MHVEGLLSLDIESADVHICYPEGSVVEHGRDIGRYHDRRPYAVYYMLQLGAA